MKRILLIATGGTIASRPTQDGLAPQMTAAEILDAVPEIRTFCRIDAIQLMNIDSTNMSPECWLQMAACVEKNYGAYDGFVITHGTDTMAYTSCALSYLIQDSGKPVILTGSQRSIFFQETDARRNLTDAFAAASLGDLQGVYIVFDGRVIVGTRARKVRTKSMNAFDSIDYPDAALVRDGRILRYLSGNKTRQGPRFFHELDRHVCVVRLIPGMDPEILLQLSAAAHALVIESFGVGGLPCYENRDFLRGIETISREGKPIVITTQVPHEGSDLEVYAVGAQASRLPMVMQAYTMTVEAVVTKLMWLLPLAKSPGEIREMFYRSIAFDLLHFESIREEKCIL